MDLQELIFNQTNGGLDIILNYYPHARVGKNFKIREERTASASLKQVEGGIYVVTDFGDDSKPRNAVAVYAYEEGLTYKEALIQLSRKYGASNQPDAFKPEIRKLRPTEVDYLDSFTESGHFFEYNTELTEEELGILGPLVTQEVCNRYRLFSVKFYAKKKENEIVQISSTESFPIFAMVNKTKEGKEWIKVLQPKSEDKSFRFFYVGGRPADFVFGLDYAQKKFAEIQQADDDEGEGDSSSTKLERIVIASGDRDGLNLAGSGEIVIWLNSETATFSTALYTKLKYLAKQIVNVPDIDQTGKRQGVDLALEYLDIFTAWLPAELAQSRDFRGNPKKDFLDFCNKYRYDSWKLKNEIRLLIDNARSCQFWIVKYQKTGVAYDLSNVNTYYFLSICGFYRMTNPENKDDFIFVKKSGHRITRVNYLQVKDFVNSFLEHKQKILGERMIPNALRNMVYNTNKMSESSLINLPTLNPDFIDYDKYSQTLFFRDRAWKITKNGVLQTEQTHQNVWVDDLIDRKIEKMYNVKIDMRHVYIEEDYFTIYEGKDKNLDIKINRTDCEFLNYLINTSRVFWDKENVSIEPNTETAYNKYWSENKFRIDSELLNPDEIFEQKMHLINKIFLFGYLMHRYKNPNSAWLVWLMDNEIVDDNESHGRTGKSLFSNSLRVFMESKVIKARTRKLFENAFIFDGVTEHTDYLLFDDANKYFDVGNIYTEITGDFSVNPKNNKPFVIPFSKSPKMVVSTNYANSDTSSSTSDRLLIGVFSNYYHAESKGQPRRTPMDDFGHLFFNDWKSDEWNRFFNFAAQALKFYLNAPEKINAPDANVVKRNCLALMGAAFQNWADNYFTDYLNNDLDADNYFLKEEAYEAMKSGERSLSSASSIVFTKKLNYWCTFNDVILDPPEKHTTSDGRIFKWHDGKTKQFHFLLRTPATSAFLTLPSEDKNTDELNELNDLNF